MILVRTLTSYNLYKSLMKFVSMDENMESDDFNILLISYF